MEQIGQDLFQDADSIGRDVDEEARVCPQSERSPSSNGHFFGDDQVTVEEALY
jgi:hypothetical protein